MAAVILTDDVACGSTGNDKTVTDKKWTASTSREVMSVETCIVLLSGHCCTDICTMIVSSQPVSATVTACLLKDTAALVNICHLSETRLRNNVILQVTQKQTIDALSRQMRPLPFLYWCIWYAQMARLLIKSAIPSTGHLLMMVACNDKRHVGHHSWISASK